MKSAALLLAALTLAGCATTSGTAPTSTISGFDGGRVVNIAPHGAACTEFFCPGLGAQWNSTRPDSAVVTVAIFNEIRGITGAQISVDGQATTWRKLTPLTNFSRAGDPLKVSSADFSVPMREVRAIASGQHRVWLRVLTTAGYSEVAVIDGSTDSKAFHALRRFVAEVDGTK